LSQEDLKNLLAMKVMDKAKILEENQELHMVRFQLYFSSIFA